MRIQTALLTIGCALLLLAARPAAPLPMWCPRNVELGWIEASRQCPEMAKAVKAIKFSNEVDWAYAWVWPGEPIIYVNFESFDQSYYTWRQVFIHEMRHIEQFEEGWNMTEDSSVEQDAWDYGFGWKDCH